MLSKHTQNEIVNVVRSVVEPEAIILFGSYVRDEERDGSDIDIMVITQYDGRRAAVTGKLYEAFRGFGRPKDIILVKPKEVERFRNSNWSIIHTALNEGVFIYGQ
jgi:predicted nucleotidyltransferase